MIDDRWREEKKTPRRTFWSHWADSNRRPTHYECVALPTEPQWLACALPGKDNSQKERAKVVLFFETAKFFGIFFA